MKKILIACLVLMMCLVGCGSKGSTSRVNNRTKMDDMVAEYPEDLKSHMTKCDYGTHEAEFFCTCVVDDLSYMAMAADYLTQSMSTIQGDITEYSLLVSYTYSSGRICSWSTENLKTGEYSNSSTEVYKDNVAVSELYELNK